MNFFRVVHLVRNAHSVLALDLMPDASIIEYVGEASAISDSIEILRSCPETMAAADLPVGFNRLSALRGYNLKNVSSVQRPERNDSWPYFKREDQFNRVVG